MGRSVLTLGGDAVVAYQSFDPSHFCEEHESFECECDLYCEAYCDHSGEWQDLVDYVTEEVIRLFPSLREAEGWVGDENRIVAANAHSIVTISEYGGLVAVSLGSNYNRDEYWRDPTPGLGAHWRTQVEDKFLKAFSEYNKVGTFSDGTSAYEKIGA